MNETNKNVVSQIYEQFLNKYSHKYDKQTLEYIRQNFWKNIGAEFNDSILFQIYSELGIYNNEFYLSHLEKIKQNFYINCDVLDIASGAIPVFANLLAKEQLELNCGSVTIYDPRLISTSPKYNNIIINQKPFNLKINIAPYKLITGILPCEVTEDIIRAACINQKDFYIALCGCDHFTSEYDEYTFVDVLSYEEYIINTAKWLVEKYNNGILVIDRLDDNSLLNYPILYNKRK